MKHRLWIYGPTLAYMLLIFILSSFPTLKPPDLGLKIEDKIVHVLEYSILGALLCRSVLFHRKPTIGLMIGIFIIGLFYGLSDEIHQAFVPNRCPSVWDALADSIGVLVGQLIFWFWKNLRFVESG